MIVSGIVRNFCRFPLTIMKWEATDGGLPASGIRHCSTFPLRHHRAVTYAFQVLAATEPGVPILRADVAEALTSHGVWERLVEVRMGAGPTVRIERTAGTADVFEVEVSWGLAQAARSRVHGQDAALESADRLAQALYEVRASARVADE
jgi:hypothetical protein